MPKTDQTYTVRLNVRLTPEQFRRLKYYCHKKGVNLTDAARTAIDLLTA